MNLTQATENWHKSQTNEKPCLVFTFDDGYADNIRYAVPILNEFGISGTFFIISSLNDTPSSTWYDQLARAVQVLLRDWSSQKSRLSGTGEADRWLAKHLHPASQPSAVAVVGAAKKLATKQRLAVVKRAAGIVDLPKGSHDERDIMMTLEEVKMLAGQGHEIGAHTRTHPILTQLEDDELVSELEGGRDDLSNAIGREITSLAYPNGDYDKRVIEASRRAGYRYAVTTVYGLNKRGANPLSLRRIYISQDRLTDAKGDFSRNVFQLELSGTADALYLRRLRRGAKA